MVAQTQGGGRDEEKWLDQKVDWIWGIREKEKSKLTPKFWLWAIDHSYVTT